MKQSILFEQGKLYVVELPEKPKHNCYGKPHCCMYKRCKHLEYDTAQAIAIKNKVEVKNTEFVTSTYFGFVKLEYGKDLKDGNTFPLPDDLTFDKETEMLKRIEPEKPTLPEGLHNGMTAQQVYEWLDKRCMFEPHQTDYVLLIIKLIINAKLST